MLAPRYDAPEEVAVDPQETLRLAVDLDLPAPVVALGDHEQLTRRRLGHDVELTRAVANQGRMARLARRQGNVARNERSGCHVDRVDIAVRIAASLRPSH